MELFYFVKENDVNHTKQMVAAKPLCVDLDGTLIKTDMLWECIVRLLKQKTFMLFMLPLWLLKGKIYLKSTLASLVDIDVATLPYDETVLGYVRNAKEAGQEVILCTGSYYSIAEAVAGHLELFSSVLATTDEINLTGRNKAEVLVDRYGRQGYSYIGNEIKDFHVWDDCSQVVCVSGSKSFGSKFEKRYSGA